MPSVTINGDTNIAATTLVALFSMRPNAARQLQKIINNCIDTVDKQECKSKIVSVQDGSDYQENIRKLAFLLATPTNIQRARSSSSTALGKKINKKQRKHKIAE